MMLRKHRTLRTVIIVGAGLSGTATAIRLLRVACPPLEIQLWERRSEFRYAGPAYSREGNPWAHIFNIQAGRMSLFREDTLDFVRWANEEAVRSDWPTFWKAQRLEEHGPAPRRIFHDYLEQRLLEAAGQAEPGVVLTNVAAEALNIIPTEDEVLVARAAARRST